MNFTELLGTTFDCECGRRHEVPVKKLIYAEDAMERLGEVLEEFVGGRRILVVADARTWAVAGEQAWGFLERCGWSTHRVIVPDTTLGSPVCDDDTFNRLKEKAPPAAMALAVGSGVINDLTKWLAVERDIPYAVVATAASMNGYTAANVGATIKGVKLLVSGRAAAAVLGVPSIIAEAPYELTAAGLGDALAKSVSTADWMMNHIFHGEHFCRFCSEMINTLEPYYLNHPEDIKNRQPEALDALYKALIYSGIAMTLIGTSAPASGGEHLLSHTLDMLTTVDGAGHDYHGRQVGVGTIFCSALYERIIKITDPECNRLPAEIDAAFWGRLAGNVNNQYQQKKTLLENMYAKITDGKTWGAFLGAVGGQVRSAEETKSCLAAAGAAHTYTDIKCSRERLRAAILHTHEMRKRTTVIDLAWMLGILPDAADEIIDTWLGE